MAGRPERGLPDDGTPLVRLALRLRELRRSAGSPSYREMGQRSHRSPTTLSEAAGGERLPTWDTVEAYVAACRGDLDGWREAWETAGGRPVERPADAVPVAVPDAVLDPDPDGAGVVVAPSERVGGGGRSRWLWPAVAVACTVVGVVAGYLLGTTASAGDASTAAAGERTAALVAASASPSPTTTETPAVTVLDGSDPEDTGCARMPGVTVLDTAEVDLGGKPAGVVELKYSPRCGAAWPRFVPFTNDVVPEGVVVHTDVVRPAADGAGPEELFPFSAAHVQALPTWGNQAVSTTTCVLAAVSLETGEGQTPESRTHCFRGAVYVR